MALSAKQRRFVEAYDGNGTEAARVAGYKGSDGVLAQVAHENLRKPEIKRAIAERERSKLGPIIATRQERQAFWTRVMNDEKRPLFARLKASELLGKSEADFTDNINVKGKLTLEQALLEAMKQPPEGGST